MDYKPEDVDQVVQQYANDLSNLGVLQSKQELFAYFSKHGKPGAELEILHKFISDYFKTKLGTVSDDVLDKEAEILMRIFPGYNKQHTRFLLYYYAAEINRVEIVMRIMLLHSNNQPKAEGQPDTGDTVLDTAVIEGDTPNIEHDMMADAFGNYHLDQPGPSKLITQKAVPIPVSVSSLFPELQQQQMMHPTFDNKYTLPFALQPYRVRRTGGLPSATIVRPSMHGDTNSELLKTRDSERNTSKSIPKFILRPAMFDVPVYTTNSIPKTSAATVTSSNNDHKELKYLDGSTLNLPSIGAQAMNLIVQPKTEVHVHAQGGNPTNNIYLKQVVYKKEAKAKNKEQWQEQKQQKNAEAPSSPLDRVDMDRRRDVGARRRMPFGDAAEDRPLPKYIRLQNPNDLVILNDSDSDISNEDHSKFLSGYLPSTDSEEDENMIPENATNLDEPTIVQEEGASSSSYNVKLVSHVMEMFPDACPKYVRKLCQGKSMTDQNVDAVIQSIFSVPDYPKREAKEPSPEPELDFEAQVQLLKEILPDADPTYLESQAQMYLGDNEAMKKFITNAVEHRRYPTMKEYLRRQQLNAQVKQYTTEFDVEKFLDIIPDPETHFREAEKRILEDPIERHLCIQILKNLYSHLLVRHIMAVFNARKNLIVAANELDLMAKNPKNIMKSRRKQVPVDLSALQNIPILQEIAYLNHRPLILDTIKQRKLVEMLQREEAKANNLMETCSCCFDDEVMLKDVFKCDHECSAFCRSCIQKSVEVKFGEGKVDFPCFKECTPNSVFTLATLKAALNPKLFSKVAQKKQLDEVKAAGIEDLVMCPFCDFATIPPPGDKIFKCLNPECMKESCRECKEPSHVPLRCDEIEKDADVQKRTYIENKMTEALLRTCYNCGLKYIKEDGCNKMTCTRCSAQMCYVCLQPVKDYKHFNGQGGDNHHLCPLYSDTNQLHVEQVIRGAQQAKDELGINNEELKIDPTADIQKHYNNKKSGAAKQHALDPFRDFNNRDFVEQMLLERHNARLAAERHHHHRHHHHHHHRPQNHNNVPDRRYL